MYLQKLSLFNDSRQAYFVDLIFKLYAKNTWVSFFTHIRFLTGSFFQLETYVPKRGKILDLGCGYGIFTNYLALCSSKRVMAGIDIDRYKIAKANKGVKNVSFIVGDATKMKIKNLDAILLHDVLHHLKSYREQNQLIKDCYLMLRDKGFLIIVEVDNKPIWKWILGRLTDFLMYKGQRVYYRYKKEMLFLLKKYFLDGNIKTEVLRNSPFPQLVYICQKE